MLARAVTSLSSLSGGRVVLGIGAGGYWGEIVKMGIQERTPGSAVEALEEAITLVRLLSSGGPPVTFEGKYYQVTGVEPAPAPAPPVWTGSVGSLSLAVTGRLADGWIPGRASDWLSGLCRTSRPVIDEAAMAAGRGPASIATIYNLPGQVTVHDQPRVRDREGRWIGGSVTQWIEELAGAVIEHGASGFVLFPADGMQPDLVLARWAREIVPGVREAIAKEALSAAPQSMDWQGGYACVIRVCAPAAGRPGTERGTGAMRAVCPWPTAPSRLPRDQARRLPWAGGTGKHSCVPTTGFVTS
jgi:hypothetical protein